MSDWPDAPCRRGRKQGKARGLAWVLGPGSRHEWARWKGGQVGRLGIRWGHLGQSDTLDSDKGLRPLGRLPSTRVPVHWRYCVG